MKILSSSDLECPHSKRHLKALETHLHSSGPADLVCSRGSFFSFAAETTVQNGFKPSTQNMPPPPPEVEQGLGGPLEL